MEGLGKKFGERWLFRNLQFNLAVGEGLIVTGTNGSGKSTLLKVLAGLVSPSAGKVKRKLTDYRTGLGFAALEMSLYPALTAREHLELCGELRGCAADWEMWLDRIELAHAANLPASKMSTGMKARLKFALAMQARPSILLLDEPGAGLDEKGKSLVSSLCAEQLQRGVLVVATNDAEERKLGTLELEIAS